MDYPQSVRSRMFQWYDEPVSVISRLEPKVKDVSPCSEYTRYTVEGVLKDPRSRFSAVLDVNSMGPIFTNSTLKDPKWSSRLGYGMGVVGEDTRIHIHRNGKYIIRRAMDREHAESTYKMIVHMMKPVLFDSDSERFLWDILRERITTHQGTEGILPMMNWPSDEEIPSFDLDEIIAGAKEIDGMILSSLRSSLMEGSQIDVEGLKEQIHNNLLSTSTEMQNDIDRSLGRYCGLIWALRSLEIIDDRILGKIKEYETWDTMGQITDEDISISTEIQVKIAQLHFLLHPVN